MNVQLLRAGATVPTYGTEFSAGADLYACLESPVTIQPGQTGAIPTGIAIEVPVGYAGLVYARSGMATKRDLAPANKVGVIDSDYRGELLVMLHNRQQPPDHLPRRTSGAACDHPCADPHVHGGGYPVPDPARQRRLWLHRRISNIKIRITPMGGCGFLLLYIQKADAEISIRFYVVREAGVEPACSE